MLSEYILSVFQEDFIGEIDSDRHNQLHFLLTFLSRLVLNFPSVQTRRRDSAGGLTPHTYQLKLPVNSE